MDATFHSTTDGATRISPFRVRLKAAQRKALRASAVPEVRRDLLLQLYAALLAVVLATLLVVLWLLGLDAGSPYTVAILAVAAAYAEANAVRVSALVDISVSTIFVIFAAVLFGPIAAIIVATVGLLVDLVKRDAEQPLLRWLVWTGSCGLIAGISGLAVLAAGGPAPHAFLRLVGVVCAAAVADAVGDVVMAPVAAVIRGRARWWDVARVGISLHLSSLPLYVPLLSGLAYVYLRISPWAVVLFVAPSFVAQRLSLLYQQQRRTADDLRDANARLLSANLSFAGALVATLDARDKYTAGHSASVAVYARDIAARLGLPVGDQEKAYLCGLVHDVGKVGLAAGLLEKTGTLNLEERRQMEEHSVIGERILSRLEDYQDVAHIVRHHHERVDGNGYPDRLRGDEIPLISRIITVADAYNAMTSDRPYREAMPSRVARMRLASAVGTQFDTAVTAAFEAILAQESEDYRMAKGAAFTHQVSDERSESVARLAS